MAAAQGHGPSAYQRRHHSSPVHVPAPRRDRRSAAADRGASRRRPHRAASATHAGRGAARARLGVAVLARAPARPALGSVRAARPPAHFGQSDKPQLDDGRERGVAVGGDRRSARAGDAVVRRLVSRLVGGRRRPLALPLAGGERPPAPGRSRPGRRDGDARPRWRRSAAGVRRAGCRGVGRRRVRERVEPAVRAGHRRAPLQPRGTRCGRAHPAGRPHGHRRRPPGGAAASRPGAPRRLDVPRRRFDADRHRRSRGHVAPRAAMRSGAGPSRLPFPARPPGDAARRPSTRLRATDPAAAPGPPSRRAHARAPDCPADVGVSGEGVAGADPARAPARSARPVPRRRRGGQPPVHAPVPRRFRYHARPVHLPPVLVPRRGLHALGHGPVRLARRDGRGLALLSGPTTRRRLLLQPAPGVGLQRGGHLGPG